MKRALLLLVLAACGGPELEAPAPLQVVVASSAPWAAAPDLDARVRARVGLALAYWQAPPETLDGWTLTIADAELACGGRGGGCAYVTRRALEVADNFGPCVEAAPIAHEVGHAVLGGDGGHTDPRWSGLLAAGLAAGAYHCSP